MINWRTAVLFSMFGFNLGKMLFSLSLFFANYLHFVCFVLKKIKQVFTNDRNIIISNNRNKNDLIQDTFPFSLGHALMMSINHNLHLQPCLNIPNTKQKNTNHAIEETEKIQLFKIKDIESFEKSNNCSVETDSEIDDQISTELDDFEEEQYNFDFIDAVCEDSFEC